MCSIPRFDVPNARPVDVFNVIMAAECGLPDCEQVDLQAGEKIQSFVLVYPVYSHPRILNTP